MISIYPSLHEMLQGLCPLWVVIIARLLTDKRYNRAAILSLIPLIVGGWLCIFGEPTQDTGTAARQFHTLNRNGSIRSAELKGADNQPVRALLEEIQGCVLQAVESAGFSAAMLWGICVFHFGMNVDVLLDIVDGVACVFNPVVPLICF